MINIFDLKTEFDKNPIGINTSKPRFSWKYECSADIKIKYYQIKVSTTKKLLDKNKIDLWDSGKKLIINNNFLIEYSGKKLKSRSCGFWKIILYSKKSQEFVSNEVGYFELSLLQQTDWLANWIGFPAGRNGKALYFRNSYEIQPNIFKSRAYICGIGCYEFRINGKKVGDRVLEPSQTQYGKTVLYSVYDITNYLKTGKNVFGAIVGNGWYGMPKLIVQIEIEYNNGNKQIIITDGRNNNDVNLWKVSDGPILSNSIFDGEYYDANYEKIGWDKPDKNEKDYIHGKEWIYSMVVDSPEGELISQTMEAVRIVGSLKAKTLTEPKPGVFVYDNEQNLSGWAKITAKGKPGTKLSMKFSETLNEDGTVNQEHLRFALAKDTYIFSKNSKITWEPRFTYHGFRYIQLEGYEGKPSIEAIKTQIVRSDLDVTGSFKSSNPFLNKLHKAIIWTEFSNLLGVPTDCPQRAERMGWLNDMTARSEELIYNFNVSRFLPKWLRDINDSQESTTGAISDTAPFRWGARPGDPVCICNVIIPWLLYKHYGDYRVLNEQYNWMKKSVQYFLSRLNNFILEDSYIGDWAPPLNEAVKGSIGTSAVSSKTPGSLISTAHLYHSLILLTKITDVIGLKDDNDEFLKIASRIKKEFNKRFWDKKSGGYASNNQACNSTAIYMDLVPENRKENVINNLVKNIEDHEFHLTTGNLSTKYIFEALSKFDKIETAYKLLIQRSYPSWGFMFEKGATTIWERWEEATGFGMNSHNHGMYASVGSWLYKSLAGIRHDEDSVGFSKIIINPKIPSQLGSVKASINTVKGLISSEWEKNDSNFILKIKIPNGTEAKVDMPILNSDEKNKTYPRIKFKKIYADNVYDLKEDNKKITFKLKEGGDYKFNYEIGESG